MRNFCKSFAIAGALLTASVLPSPSALAGPGDLLVAPVRVVFEGRERIAEVTLVNKGQDRATYRIGFENRRMHRDGSFEAIDEPAAGERFAEDLVRYAPRRVTLEPNAPQTLRLMLRKPSSLEAGEYRSHLHFSAVPDESRANSIETTEENDVDLSIKLTPVYGLTIPIIVRHGAITANAAFGDARIKETPRGAAIEVVLKRGGDMSLYGDIAVMAGDEKTPITIKRGVAVYTPNAERIVNIPLTPDQLAVINGRQVTFSYRDRTDMGAGVQATASAQL